MKRCQEVILSDTLGFTLNSDDSLQTWSSVTRATQLASQCMKADTGPLKCIVMEEPNLSENLGLSSYICLRLAAELKLTARLSMDMIQSLKNLEFSDLGKKN